MAVFVVTGQTDYRVFYKYCLIFTKASEVDDVIFPYYVEEET